MENKLPNIFSLRNIFQKSDIFQEKGGKVCFYKTLISFLRGTWSPKTKMNNITFCMENIILDIALNFFFFFEKAIFLEVKVKN